LMSGSWGWVHAKPGAPEVFGTSPVLWLVLAGILLLFCLMVWETHRVTNAQEPLVRPSMLRNRQLQGGLSMFFFQFFIQAGVFFTIPLFLSVVLELSALQTGVRLLPLSFALLLTAIAVPKVLPTVSPRLIVRCGILSMLAGTLVLIGGLSPGADASIVAIPMVLMGLGIGALASQLGAVTVSAVPDAQSAEVGGVQNTVTNFGAALGTALVGAVLISSLTAGLVHGVEANSTIPSNVKTEATVKMTNGVPFISDTDLRRQLDQASVPQATADAIVAENATARLAALRDALWVVALMAGVALLFTGLMPKLSLSKRATSEEQPRPLEPEGIR